MGVAEGSCLIASSDPQDGCIQTASHCSTRQIERLLVRYRRCVPVALLVTAGTATTNTNVH